MHRENLSKYIFFHLPEQNTFINRPEPLTEPENININE